MENVIYKKGKYRIIETQFDDFYIDDLKGDCFNPEIHSDIDVELLKKAEKEFINKVYNEGVYGYVLEKWNGKIGKGWEHIDSIYGFIGQHKNENHYIIEEFKNKIKKKV